MNGLENLISLENIKNSGIFVKGQERLDFPCNLRHHILSELGMEAE